MELRRLLQAASRQWFVIPLVVVGTVFVTGMFVVDQEPSYTAKGSFVIRPRSVQAVDETRALDTLVRGPEINSTYATIARSDIIRERAEQRLGEPVSGNYTTDAEVMAGTNVLEISVTGPNPRKVRDLALLTGRETVSYVAELNDIFHLSPLDTATLPEEPASNTKLMLATGGVLGLGLALFAAVLLDAVRQRGRRLLADPTVLVGGVLESGLPRSPKLASPLSVGILTVSPRPDGDGGEDDATAAAAIALALEHMPDLGPDAVVVDLGEGTLLAVLPETATPVARALLDRWRANIRRASTWRYGTSSEAADLSTVVVPLGDGAPADRSDTMRVDVG